MTETIIVPNADIISLPTVLLELLASPGAGKIRWPLSAVVAAVGWTPYGNDDNGGTNLVLTIGNQRISLPTQPWLSSGDAPGAYLPIGLNNPLQEIQKNVSALENQPIRLFYENNGAGNLTGGDGGNSLIVTINYIDQTIS